MPEPSNAGKATPRILTAASAVAVAALILTISFALLLTPLPTRMFAESFVLDDVSQASHGYLVQLACDTLSYVNGQDVELPLGSDDAISYTPEVMSHLDDVAGLFGAVKAATAAIVIAAIAIMAADAVYCRRKHLRAKRLAGRALLLGPAVLMAVVAVLAIAAAADFDGFFNALHSLFFSSGTWLFAYDSLLICALPEMFWVSMGILWAALMLALSAICVVLGVVFSRKGKLQ